MVKNKKAVSAMVGYVLLVTFGIVMSIVVYNYIKTYVPKDLTDCPEGVSIFLKEYDCESNMLTLTLKNNGKFNYGGYFVYGATKEDTEIATINLANYFDKTTGTERARFIQDSYVLFSQDDFEFLKPNEEVTHEFIIQSENINEKLKLLEITPVRFQKENGKSTLVSCGKSKIREEIICG